MLLHSLLLAWAPPPTPNTTLIQQYLASAHIPSVSLAVVTGNGSAIPYTAAFGAADLKTGRKSTPGDPGVATMMSFNPATGVGVVALTNGDWGDAGHREAHEAIVGHLYDVFEQ